MDVAARTYPLDREELLYMGDGPYGPASDFSVQRRKGIYNFS